MNRPPDKIDNLCAEWAARTRPLLNIANASDLDGTDALTALQATATALVQVNPPRTSTVSVALNALRFEQRQLIQLHFLMDEIPVRHKAKFAGLTPPVYYAMFGTAKEFLRGHMDAAAIGARIPSTMRPRGTITLSRAP